MARRKLNPRKLLVASTGVATVSYLVSAPGCGARSSHGVSVANLMAPVFTSTIEMTAPMASSSIPEFVGNLAPPTPATVSPGVPPVLGPSEPVPSTMPTNRPVPPISSTGPDPVIGNLPTPPQPTPTPVDTGIPVPTAATIPDSGTTPPEPGDAAAQDAASPDAGPAR